MTLEKFRVGDCSGLSYIFMFSAPFLQELEVLMLFPAIWDLQSIVLAPSVNAGLGLGQPRAS